MKISPRVLIALVFSLLLPGRARAVYAPIPEHEKGRLFTLYVNAGVYYDSNIFGAPENAVDSYICRLQPTAVFNISASDQTLFSGGYQVTIDRFDSRPGDKQLISQSVNARLAHTFSRRMDGEISDVFQVQKNPATLLPGVAAQLIPDQSYDYNQFDGRLRYNLDKRNGFKGKLRVASFWYDNPYLERDLDRTDWLAGVEWVRLSRPELQLCAEYRYRAVRYGSDGGVKDKDSHYFLAGADYLMGLGVALSGRLGVEALLRNGGEDAALPYIELGLKKDYREESFISAGYSYSTQEASDIKAYTDMYVHRLFLNVQHRMKKIYTLALALDMQPAVLNARKGIAEDIHEQMLRAGVSLTWAPTSRLSFSCTFDYDNINSQDPNRELQRVRAGVYGRWIF